MKELWLRLDSRLPKARKLELLKLAEGHFAAAVLSPEDLPLANGLKLQTASTDERSDIHIISTTLRDGDAIPANAAVEMVVKDRGDEEKVLQFADAGIRYALVKCPNWKVIPLENLIARTRNKVSLLADVSSVSEAQLALQTLELGVDGVVISATSSDDLEVANSLSAQENLIHLAKGKVVNVKQIGQGARVCVDTCELMKPGEGMLVGSQSAGLFLVEAEVHMNPHVEPRPFRVNAGPVSSYVLVPGRKTRYLAELQAGDEILIVDRSGATRTVHIGRVKIERRPMVVVETEAEGRRFSTILQNAETVRLVSDSASTPVSELKQGNIVLLRVEEGGRHFGTLVADEMVIER
ncbi:MAG TPA: 3-dehydroquinate synthase II [Candidatus Dormibacteraeota bacterium]|nr:3-dehydroquinate synthase II [Candidatus Dormibacteraeota bacterium]